MNSFARELPRCSRLHHPRHELDGLSVTGRNDVDVIPHNRAGIQPDVKPLHRLGEPLAIPSICARSNLTAGYFSSRISARSRRSYFRWASDFRSSVLVAGPNRFRFGAQTSVDQDPRCSLGNQNPYRAERRVIRDHHDAASLPEVPVRTILEESLAGAAPRRSTRERLPSQSMLLRPLPVLGQSRVDGAAPHRPTRSKPPGRK